MTLLSGLAKPIECSSAHVMCLKYVTLQKKSNYIEIYDRFIYNFDGKMGAGINQYIKTQ